jgi:hypothetical protein
MGKQPNMSGKGYPNFDDLISLKSAAVSSGLSADHLRRLAGQGEIWAKKIGRNWVTTKTAVSKYLARNRHPGPKRKH